MHCRLISLYLAFFSSLTYGMWKIPVSYFRERNLEFKLEKKLGLFEKYSRKYEYQKEKLRQLAIAFDFIQKKYSFERKKIKKIRKIMLDIGKPKSVPKEEAEGFVSKIFGKTKTAQEIFVSFNKKLKNSYYMFQFIRSLYFDTALNIMHYDYLIDMKSDKPLAQKKLIGSDSFASSSLILESLVDPGVSKVMKYSTIYNRAHIFKIWPKFEFFYYRHLHKLGSIFFSLFLALMSFLVFALQMISASTKISSFEIVSMIMKEIGNDILETACISLLMVFMTSCVYFFLFKYNMFFYLGVKLEKKSTLPLLVSTSSFFTYFTFPLCMNTYFIFIGFNGTSFQDSLGKFVNLEFLGIDVIKYFPFAMVVIIIFLWLNIVKMITNYIGISGSSGEDGDLNTSTVRENREVFKDKIANTILEIENYYSYLKNKNIVSSIILDQEPSYTSSQIFV